MQTRVTCSTCGGEGKIIKEKCKECSGEGIVYGEEVVTVKIPAGVAEGMQLTMNGKGNAGKHNGIPGDLLILIEEETDKVQRLEEPCILLFLQEAYIASGKIQHEPYLQP